MKKLFTKTTDRINWHLDAIRSGASVMDCLWIEALTLTKGKGLPRIEGLVWNIKFWCHYNFK